jgi:DNA-binding CsgD family transcriptional regulator
MSWSQFLEEVAKGRKFNEGESEEWPISPLSEAEKKVLTAILPTSDGGELTQKEVAKQLNIERSTVMSHLGEICYKFSVDAGKGRTEKLRQKLQAKFKSIPVEESDADPTISEQSIHQFNWRTACKERLELQKKQITSSPLLRKGRDLDSVHVPLGLG